MTGVQTCALPIFDTFLPKLDKTDFDVDEKQRTVTLTEAGMEKIETLLRDAGQLKGDSLYDVENVSVVHHINQALRAHTLFTRDKDYIVRDDEAIIIDEFIGRMMQGPRYSEGLHQALEAKEHVRFSRKTRRWPRSRSRTISGCTKSSPA